MHWNSLNVSYRDYVDPSSMETSVSTSVDLPYISHMSPHLDDVYVNLVSLEDVSGISSSSCGPSSSSPPIIHFNEDIMESMTTPDYPWDDMHHCVYFLWQQTHDQYVVKSKDFIHGEVNWFNKPLLQTDKFKPHPPYGCYITNNVWVKGHALLKV